MNSIMYEYLFLLAGKFLGNRLPAGEKKSNCVEEALRYIEDRCCDPVTIQDVADHLGLNRSYLHRIFKSVTGMSIRVIAHSVSYIDPLYFSRIFRQNMGISPSQYRQKHSGRSGSISCAPTSLQKESSYT